MIKKGLKLAGVIAGAFLMLAGFETEVYAEPSDPSFMEKSNESLSGINCVLATQDWKYRAAAANVKEYASIREKKDSDSTKAGVLPKGAYVEVLERGEEWTLVSSDKIEGYILTKFLVFAEDAKEIYSDIFGVKGIVTAENAKIMDHPYSKSNIIAKKVKGSEIEILAQIGNWYRVQLNKSTTAYMNVEDIEITDVVAMTVEEYNKETGTTATDKKTETTSNKTTTSTSGVNASKSDLDMLAAIIQCEAEGESYKGKVAVGAVVLNRVRSNKFPNTIGGVIKQKGQFTPVASGKFARVLSRGANAECYRAAKDALNGSNPIGKCLFFNTGYGKGFRLGGHQFY